MASKGNSKIRADAISLLKRFTEKGSFDFETFQREWMETKFYFIHCAARDDLLKKNILETIFETMTQVITKESSSLIERIGALYIWYAVYFTEPTQHFVKIRVTAEVFAMVENFHLELRRCGHVHADYVLCRLKSFSAFLVCLLPRKMCMGQQGEYVDCQLDAMGKQTHIDPQSNVMCGLRHCQSMLSVYHAQKKALEDHLPTHLLNCSAMDELLSPAKLQALKVPLGSEEDKTEEEETEGDVEEDEPLRRKLVQRAYQSEPGNYKRRKSNH